MDLADFLLARIAEDEAIATAARGLTIRGDEPASEAALQRFGSARVLAECAAKRQIVQSAVERMSRYDEEVRDLEDGEAVDLYSAGARDISIRNLRLMAAVYADHPDYRRKWELRA